MIQQLNQSLHQPVERDKQEDLPANALGTPSIDNNIELDRTDESIDARISEALDEADNTFFDGSNWSRDTYLEKR